MPDAHPQKQEVASYVAATATLAILATLLSVVYCWNWPSGLLGLTGIWWWSVVALWCLVSPLCWVATYASAREVHGYAAKWLLWTAPFAFQGPVIFIVWPWGLILAVCSFQRCYL